MDNKTREQIIVDIFLILGGKSGLEAVVNRTAEYLSDNGCIIRIIQVIKTDVEWATKKVSFFCFDMNRDINFQECKKKYLGLIEKDGAPDIVFATGLPVTSYLAKLTFSEMPELSCPVVAWPHNDIAYYDENMDSTKNFWQYTDFFFAISDKIAHDISILFPEKIIYRVNNPVNPEKIVYSEKRSSNRLAFVGRLSEEKNVPLILRALSNCKSKWQLSIVGEGPDESNIRKLEKELNLNDSVELCGWVDNPWEILTDHRALVMASTNNFEGAPLTCIEALACGMPVISTPVANVPEIVISGKNGYIYNFDDADALTHILDVLSETEHKEDDSICCKESVNDYLPEVALWDFFFKTVASSKLFRLPQANWQDKDSRIIRHEV